MSNKRYHEEFKIEVVKPALQYVSIPLAIVFTPR
ncbi:hypothetical protein WP3W18E06_28680 [Raoultella ornithinolytica]|nr:hypothetical protein AI2711V1_2714 [Raoultella ornithinolytica]CAH3539906.1 hypothetical protein AI2711V1_2714 [Raoultella ornithinolytica]SMQ90977.1 Uncharacterised protein [Raoultella ornithinolytica]VEB72844.1 Uncharacterised protein [Raoultella ornithinolytica]VTN05490.1 Uncharacterised protein [Raoultella ornithinolytica]